MCAPRVTQHTSIRYSSFCHTRVNIVVACVARTSLVVKKKNFFGFPVVMKNSVKVGPLVFLLQMFVITENIMKRTILKYIHILDI